MLDDLPGGAPAERLFERQPTISSLFLESGLRFTNFYTNLPLCCPGRATFLTGLYSHHHGVTSNDGRLFDPSVTIATALQESGYFTALAGKYLNNLHRLDNKWPAGWNHFAATSNGYYKDWWFEGSRLARSDEYHTDVLAEYAERFLRQAPDEAPVFLVLTPYATHADGQRSGGSMTKFPTAAPRHRRDQRCQGIGRYASPAYNEEDVSDKPAWVRELPLVPEVGGWPLLKACRALLSVDEMLQRVLTELRAQDRFDDTLFIITSDNGMGWGNHRLVAKGKPYATRLPLWVSWPGEIGEAPAAVRSFAQLTDLAPTLCQLAGCTLGPYPTGQSGPDGISLRDLILTRGAAVPDRTELLEERPGAWNAIRTTDQAALGLWRLIVYATGERELYEHAVDPWELQNVAGQPEYRDVESQLESRLEEILTGSDGVPNSDP